MKKILTDADIIIHLAGITDVAYTKTESNPDLDIEINKVAVEGSRNIIELSPENSKIIFPSTHVVYEGFETTTFNILESEPVRPILTYSKGKAQTEEDLKNSDKNYVILRLGSCYGLGEDTMRINIMPNLFSKISSQNGELKLFSGGIQYKSLICVDDVARCIKFMAENTKINRETFNCVHEIKTVKDVAEICRKYNPSINLKETLDEIPNLGYTLSNKKLLDTGFEFLYNIDQGIKNMMEHWSKKDLPIEFEYKYRGSKDFIDHRGKISNYELTEPINLIGYIESKVGTTRANHYHPIQEQKVLLIKGQYISVCKDLTENEAQISTLIVNEGDMIVTKPNVAHTMVFTQDSILLNLVRGEREHENYGVTHTIPYILVNEDFRKLLVDTYKTKCRVCGNKNLQTYISLGLSPLANNLLDKADDKNESYPLEVNYCSECHNSQLSCVVPPEKMFDNYLYVSSTAESFRTHFADAAKYYVDRFKLTNKSLVIDIGSNDGIALKPLNELGINTIGVEPAKNIAELANSNGINTIHSYFNYQLTKDIYLKYGEADLITASNVFAHSDKVEEITNAAFDLLKDDGVFIIEVQYLLDTIKDLTFDNIYHEHVNYWCVTSLVNFFKKLNLTVIDVEHISTHGGSIRVFIKKHTSEISDNVKKFMDSEEKFGLLNYDTYINFGKDVQNIKHNVNNNFDTLKLNYKTICGYGSPAKATTALNFFGIDSGEIDYIIEDNSLKQNKFMPGVNIPIYSKTILESKSPDLVIILAWNFFDDIVKNNKNLFNTNTDFISIKDLEKKDFKIKEKIHT